MKLPSSAAVLRSIYWLSSSNNASEPQTCVFGLDFCDKSSGGPQTKLPLTVYFTRFWNLVVSSSTPSFPTRCGWKVIIEGNPRKSFASDWPRVIVSVWWWSRSWRSTPISPPHPPESGSSVDASRRRFGPNYIDLYYSHP